MVFVALLSTTSSAPPAHLPNLAEGFEQPQATTALFHEAKNASTSGLRTVSF